MGCWQDLEASSSVVQMISHDCVADLFHPHSAGLGVAGASVIDCPIHIQPDMPLSWCVCTNDAAVGGIASIDLPFLVNNALRASFTCVHIVVRSYMRTTTCSNVGMISSSAESSGLSLSTVECGSDITKHLPGLQCSICSSSTKEDVWSYPVKAWNTGRLVLQLSAEGSWSRSAKW